MAAAVELRRFGLGMIYDKPNRRAKIAGKVDPRARERRILLGLTQQQVADLIGVIYQQLAKYERGVSRISASRLFDLR